MEISVIVDEIARVEAGAIMVSVFEGTEPLDGDAAGIDKALDGAIARLMGQGEIKGKLNEVTVIHSLGKIPAERVAVVGLGKPAELTSDIVRGAVAEALRLLRAKGVDNVATVPQGVGVAGISAETAAQAVTEGAVLGLYAFRRHITEKAEREIKKLSIVSDSGTLSDVERGSYRGKVVAEAANLARDMVNEPANYMTPGDMAETAVRLAQNYGLEVTILEEAQMRELGMGALLGVAQGSKQPPRFIILSYKGKDTAEVDITLIGKGITFDSGGISLKPPEGMGEMKGDMAGGAAVMAALAAIARLKPALNVTALVPATENMPGGHALKPGDILTAMNGKTIEIISTDAEGRIVLADAIGYARGKLRAKLVVDVATLTGACRVALGEVYSGVFSPNQELVEKVIAAGSEAGELMWQLPLHERYKEQLKSEVADFKNAGSRMGGASVAAQFLAEFAGDTPWVHLDIAPTAMTDKERAYMVKGATGVPVRTLVNLVLALAKTGE